MKISPDEFTRYSQGLSSREEKARIEEWLNAKEDDEIEGGSDEDKRLAEIWNKLEPVTVSAKKQGRILRLGLIARVAAILLLIGGIGWFLHDKQNLAGEQLINSTMKTITTGKGQRLNITLSDGSVVELNAMSELTYPSQFNGDIRLIKFKGEAFFTIARNEAKPFVIQTDSSYTKILGTRFNLRAYAEEQNVSLTVEHGKVQFGRANSTDQVILTVGMQGVLEKGKAVYSHTVKPSEYTAWVSNTLIFDNERLEDVAKRLERWYGIEVLINSDRLKSLSITGTYKNASVEKIMSSLSFSTGIHYKINNKVLTIDE